MRKKSTKAKNAGKTPGSRPAARSGDSRWSSIWTSLLVFSLAVVLRLLHLAAMDRYADFHHPVLDARYFDLWARKLAGGDWLGSEIFFVDPLYPYLLGGIYKVFGPNLEIARLIQALMGGLGAVAIHRLGVRLLGGFWGFVCGLIAATYRPFIFYDALLLKSVLKVPLTALFLYFLVGVVERKRVREALGAGLCLGLAVLVRGNLLAMIPVMAIWLAFQRSLSAPARWSAVGLFALGCALVIAPVTWRNYRVGHEIVLTTSGLGMNLYTGNHRDNFSGGYVGAPFTRPNLLYEEADFRTEARRRSGRTLGPAELSDFWVRETLKVIADDPWHWLGLMFKKITLIGRAVEVPDNYAFDFDSRRSWVLRLPFPGFALIFPLALAGMIAAWREKKRPGLRALALFAAVYLASVIPFFVTSRFRMPAVPALIVLAVFGATSVFRLLKDGPRRLALLLVAVIVLTSIYTRWPHGWIPFSQVNFNFGTALQEEGLLKEAELQFREALRLDSRYAEAWNNLGAVLNQLGRHDEAAEAFRRASQLKPGYWEADYNQAEGALRAGRVEEAVPLLETLLKQRPDSYEINLLLGMGRRRQGRLEEALALYQRALELRPDALEAGYNMALLLRDLGRLTEARERLETLARRYPAHEPTRRALAELARSE